MIGKTIGTYRLIKRVGLGGVGEVFMGEDLMLERQVAVKVMKPDLARRSDLVERFRAEAVTLAKVNHTHIATVYAFLPQEADFFLVMEYIQGWTLQHLLEVQGALAPAVAVQLIRQALDGIGFAHRHRVIHRDIKPSNIMLSDAGIIKVMDFGLARVLGTARVTQVDRFVGTVEYISPEQLRGEEADVRSDIYALGTVLYELVTGYLPFEHHSEYSLIRAKVEETPPPPRTFMRSLSQDLEGVILKALSTVPEDRFQSAEAFASALDQCAMKEDEASSLSALLFSQREYAPVDDLCQDGKCGSLTSAPSGLDRADHHATRLAEASLFSDMKPALTTSGRKSRKHRRPVLMSALLVAAASLSYFFAPLDFSHHPTLDPMTLEPPTDTSAATMPSPVVERQTAVFNTIPESPHATPGAFNADDQTLRTGDFPVDSALGYRDTNALACSAFADGWALVQPALICKVPDADAPVGLDAMATPTSLALPFHRDHALASIPTWAGDDAVVGFQPLSGQTYDAPKGVSIPLDDAVAPLPVNPPEPVMPEKTRRRKIEKKPAQRGSEWVIRR